MRISSRTPSIDRHALEQEENRRRWQAKPVLRTIYREFHQLIAANIAPAPPGLVVEVGSGVADIREVIPQCLRTDLVAAEGIDLVENAYRLSFRDREVSNLILFDVFHHLRYPGTALGEFARVLAPGGRIILFEPCVSVLGRVVYGLLHPEPLALGETIAWRAPSDWDPGSIDYYAAQGNASRVFLSREFDLEAEGWNVRRVQRLSAISYLASGGYSRPQLVPGFLFPLLRALERACDRLPRIFATRMLVVLERRADG